MTVRVFDWAVRHYLEGVHRYPAGVAVEGAIAWACVWKLAHR